MLDGLARVRCRRNMPASRCACAVIRSGRATASSPHARDALVDAAHCAGIMLDPVCTPTALSGQAAASPTAASTARTAPFFSTLVACLACPATTSYVTRTATPPHRTGGLHAVNGGRPIRGAQLVPGWCCRIARGRTAGSGARNRRPPAWNRDPYPASSPRTRKTPRSALPAPRSKYSGRPRISAAVRAQALRALLTASDGRSGALAGRSPIERGWEWDAARSIPTPLPRLLSRICAWLSSGLGGGCPAVRTLPGGRGGTLSA